MIISYLQQPHISTYFIIIIKWVCVRHQPMPTLVGYDLYDNGFNDVPSQFADYSAGLWTVIPRPPLRVGSMLVSGSIKVRYHQGTGFLYSSVSASGGIKVGCNIRALGLFTALRIPLDCFPDTEPGRITCLYRYCFCIPNGC